MGVFSLFNARFRVSLLCCLFWALISAKCWELTLVLQFILESVLTLRLVLGVLFSSIVGSFILFQWGNYVQYVLETFVSTTGYFSIFLCTSFTMPFVWLLLLWEFVSRIRREFLALWAKLLEFSVLILNRTFCYLYFIFGLSDMVTACVPFLSL